MRLSSVGSATLALGLSLLGPLGTAATAGDLNPGVLTRTGQFLPKDAALTKAIDWIQREGKESPVVKEVCDRLMVVTCGPAGVNSKSMDIKETGTPVDVRRGLICLADEQSTVVVSWTQGRKTAMFVLQPMQLPTGRSYMMVLLAWHMDEDTGLNITSILSDADKSLLNSELAFWEQRAPAR